MAIPNILAKFKINSYTYFIFLSFLLTGYFKNIILIFLIILVHELGHIFFLKLFSYEIIKVELYPFGGLTTTSKLINTPINKDIIIYLGGVFFQILLTFFMYILLVNNIISDNLYYLFWYYNKYILVFNLIPIRPLDGGEILNLFLQKKMSFIKSICFTHYISLVNLVIFLSLIKNKNLNSYMMITFLTYKLFTYYKKKNYFKNQFFLERYLYDLPYKRIEYNNKPKLDLLKKETYHYFKSNNKYINEKKLLQHRFDNY